MVSLLNTRDRTKDRSSGLIGVVLKDKTGALLDVFGEPTLYSQGNGRATWARGASASATNQKGSTNWVAKLFGGLQSGWNDAASLVIPVNELPLVNLDSMSWSYHMKNAELFGCQIQIWVHDPNEPENRADIIQSGSATLLAKSQGWNSHILNMDTGVQFFWYGENVDGEGLTEGPGNLYSLKQFKTDVLFKQWTIYRITLNNGFYTDDVVFEDMHVADVKINGTVIPLRPSLQEQLDIVTNENSQALTTIPTWMFGKPTLQAQGNGRSHWSKGTAILSTHQKGSTGWVAELHAGVQSAWDDAAELYIPVNEMPLTDLKTATTMWSWFMTDAEVGGLGMVVWVHDPDDFDKRAEITMVTGVSHIELGAGWNAHELAATDKFFWYGENTGAHGTTITAGDEYNFNQFLTDDVFGRYTIYRISFYIGFETGNYDFDPAYLADVKINGTIIPLYPDIQRFKKTANQQKTLSATTIYDVGDVMSEATGSATDWDFMFGASGKIVGATVVSPTNGLTADVDLYLYTIPPTCELDDHAPNDGPVVADAPYFIGMISFASMTSPGGISFAVATDLSLAFDTTTIYGVAVTESGATFGSGSTLDITLTAELEA